MEMVQQREKLVDAFLEPIEGSVDFNWSDGLRKEGMEALNDVSFPKRKEEEWKYTRTTKLAKNRFQIKAADQMPDLSEHFIFEDSYKLVFVNGFFQPELSNTANKTFSVSDINSQEQLKSTMGAGRNIFTQMNAAFHQNGAFIHIPKNITADAPIEVLHYNTASDITAQIRNHYTCGANAEATIIEHFKGTGTYFNNVVNEMDIAEDARFKVYRLQNDDPTAFSINSDLIDQEAKSNFSLYTFTISGGFVRNTVDINVNGEHCETNLYGLYPLKDSQHVDNHTCVDHKVPHCESKELYKGVIDGKATGVFNGKVFVRQDAQKVNAFQSNSNILLSDDGTINSKPELEIYADDVQCSHGSTTGQLDETAMFYLQARGLSKESARNTLISAFAGEVIDLVSNNSIKDHLYTLYNKEFGWIV